MGQGKLAPGWKELRRSDNATGRACESIGRSLLHASDWYQILWPEVSCIDLRLVFTATDEPVKHEDAARTDSKDQGGRTIPNHNSCALD
jgi:hypothetical protein